MPSSLRPLTSKTQAGLRSIYPRIPRIIRLGLKPITWSFAQVHKTWLPVSVFRGTSLTGSAPFTFAYAGNKDITRHYWAEHILGSDYEEHSMGKLVYTNVENRVQMKHPDCAMILLEPGYLSTRRYANKPVFTVPEWIDMEIDITPPIDVLCKRSPSGFRDTKRLIKKHDLSFMMSNNISDFDEFYSNMLIPYVTRRYGHAALIDSYSHVKDIFSHSDLLLISKGNAVIGGGLIEYRDGGVFLRKVGIRDGDFEHVRHGVLGAVYYFVTAEMRRKGYSKIHIGGSRPVLSDGVTKYKNRWLARIVPDYTPYDYTLMILLNDSPQMRDFLIHNPLIHYTNSTKPCSAIWVQSDQLSTKDEFLKVLRASRCEGVESCQIFIFDQDTIPSDWIGSDIYPKPTIERAETLLKT